MYLLKRHDGFTLVEVQVSLVILLITLALLMSALSLSIKTTKKNEHQMSITNDMRIISSFIRQRISGAVPMTVIQNVETTPVFRGEEQGLYFIGVLPSHVVKGGPRLIHLYESSGQLLLEYELFDTNLDIESHFLTKTNQITLLDSLDFFNVQYAESTLDASNQLWVQTWQDQVRLPAVIKITLSANKATWPDIVIKLHSSQTSNVSAFKLSKTRAQ